MDLLGSDLPVESDDGMKFAWSDGILLQVRSLILKVTIVSLYLRECFNIYIFQYAYLAGSKGGLLGFA